MNWIWTLLWLLLAAVVVVVVRPLWDEYSFQILTIVVFLNAIATITLWQTAARRPEKLKRKFRNRLWRSKPITPKHEPPPLEKDTPGVFGEKAKTELMQFFSDFEDFANVVNSWLTDSVEHPHGSPWRLQELPKYELLKLWAGGGPIYGRTYAVFHNQERIGEIEISPDRYLPKILASQSTSNSNGSTSCTSKEFEVSLPTLPCTSASTTRIRWSTFRQTSKSISP